MQVGSLLYTDSDSDSDDINDDVSKHSKLQQPFKVNWDVIESLPHVNQVSTTVDHSIHVYMYIYIYIYIYDAVCRSSI
jgi:hypothetical protein